MYSTTFRIKELKLRNLRFYYDKQYVGIVAHVRIHDPIKK